MNDEPSVTYCETRDEAIAVAMSDAEDGTEIAIHADDCEPYVTVVRRGAA